MVWRWRCVNVCEVDREASLCLVLMVNYNNTGTDNLHSAQTSVPFNYSRNVARNKLERASVTALQSVVPVDEVAITRSQTSASISSRASNISGEERRGRGS